MRLSKTYAFIAALLISGCTYGYSDYFTVDGYSFKFEKTSVEDLVTNVETDYRYKIYFDDGTSVKTRAFKTGEAAIGERNDLARAWIRKEKRRQANAKTLKSAPGIDPTPADGLTGLDMRE